MITRTVDGITFQITRAPSGPYANLLVCDWCGDTPGRSAAWVISSKGWDEQACMHHAAKYFSDLFDRTGRILKYRVVLVTNGGVATVWEDMSEHGFIQWRSDIQRLYGTKRPVHRSVTRRDGRKAYSWTWTSERPFGAGRWVDTLRVVGI